MELLDFAMDADQDGIQRKAASVTSEEAPR